MIYPYEIAGLSLTSGCEDECTTIYVEGSQFHLYGNILDVKCKLFGGGLCKWDSDIMPYDQFNAIMDAMRKR